MTWANKLSFFEEIQHNNIQHNNIQHNNIQHNNIQHNNIQHNNIQHNYIQHNDIQHNDIQHINIQHNYIQHNDTQLKGLYTINYIKGQLDFTSLMYLNLKQGVFGKKQYEKCHEKKVVALNNVSKLTGLKQERDLAQQNVELLIRNG